MVVLYRATGVLNLAFGAIGAFGAFIAWQLINHSGMSFWPRVRGVGSDRRVVDAGVWNGVSARARACVTRWSKRPRRWAWQLILLGVMDLLWPSSGGASRRAAHGFRPTTARSRSDRSRSPTTNVLLAGAGP